MTFNYSLLERLSEIESSISKKTSSATELYDELRVCIEEILSYMADEFKGKELTYDMLSVVFIGNDSKNFSRMNLYCLMLYLEQLLKQITSVHIHRYETVIRNIVSELAEGIILYETRYKHLSVEREWHYWRRATISRTDALRAMNQLFFIESVPDIDSLSLNAIKPNVIFIIRQMLEMKWKRVIGFESIVNTKNAGKPIHQFTQVAWAFIKKNANKKDKGWSLDLPLTIAALGHLNKWANAFVHTAIIYGDHIQFLAIEIMRELMDQSERLNHIEEMLKNKSIPHNISYSIAYGNVSIKGYNNMKRDFEEYIRKRMASAEVKWLPQKNVEAYIES